LPTGLPQSPQQNGGTTGLFESDVLRYNGGVSPDDLTPSPEFVSAVQAEREKLDEVVAALNQRYDELTAELNAVCLQLREVSERNIQLARVLGEDVEHLLLDLAEPDGDRIEADDGPQLDQGGDRGRTRRALRPRRRARAIARRRGLRGAAIRMAAVKAALGDEEPGRPRHYRDWLALIEERIDGQDPAATLLTQLSRCPLIARTEDPGVYRLDPRALVRLHSERDALRAEADERVTSTDNRDYDVIDLAQALAGVEASIRRIDRAINEAQNFIDRLDTKEFFTRPSQPEGPVQLDEPPHAIAA
jgi:hypothetical protein